MKKDIHPEYHADAKFTRERCKSIFTIGSILPEVNVEICSQCHSFYTGQEKTLDTTGRVDRFKQRQAAAKKTA